MYKRFLKNIICILLAMQIFVMPGFALGLDMSVDDEIRKNYNPSKLELESLPPLPNVKPNPQPPVTNIPGLTSPTPIKPLDKSTAIRLKKGTKFTVKSNQNISDATPEGTRISFTSQRPVTKTYVTIPQGTIFRGEVADSHPPQITGNGGLIVLSIDSMTYKGSTIGISAKITKAKHKKIFLNNIKGKHQYWKGTFKALNPGKKFYRKMMSVTARLASGTVTVILTPVTVVSGVFVYAVNFISAPFFGLFCKGGRISIPAGSEFEIKILEDVYL